MQSGKTLSFTTLTALARDNNYQIVIIIGGTSVNLLDQSKKRVRKDLRIDSRYGFETLHTHSAHKPTLTLISPFQPYTSPSKTATESGEDYVVAFFQIFFPLP